MSAFIWMNCSTDQHIENIQNKLEVVSIKDKTKRESSKTIFGHVQKRPMNNSENN